jgi:uncharacterized protein RhaS with RHS repeats
MISWHRFYDPETGRYISVDPIGLQGGMNLYAYVENDQVNKIDPLGLWSYTGKCNYVSIGDIAGAGVMVCEWESECVNGKKSIGKTETWLGGFTFGSPGGTTEFDL